MANNDLKHWEVRKEYWMKKQKFYEEKIKDHVFSNNDDDSMLNSYFVHLAIAEYGINNCEWTIELIESIGKITT